MAERKAGRKVAFWGAIAGVSIIANFGIELLAQRVPSLGLARFVAFTHKGENQ